MQTFAVPILTNYKHLDWLELGTSSTLILGNKTTTYSKLGLDVFTALCYNMYLMDFRSTFSFICITNHCNVLQ